MAAKLLDLVFFGRPILLIPVWTIYLHFYAVTFLNKRVELYPATAIIIDLVILSLIFIAVYVFNQIFDIESDRINRKLFFLPDKIISIKAAYTYYFILTPIALIISGFESIEKLILAGILVVLGIFYSVSGIRLKDRPVAGLLANALAYGILVPVYVKPSILFRIEGLYTIPYFLAIATGYVLTTLPDVKGDLATGKKTVAIILGHRGTLILGLLLALITLVASVYFANYEMAVVTLITVILVTIILWRYSLRMIMMAIKLPIAMLTLAACVHFPFYAIFLGLTIVLTRIYYKRRFNIIYPRLG